MQAKSEIGAADDAGIVFGLEPPRAQMHAPGWQTCEPAFEFGAPPAVACDENREIGKTPCRSTRFPTADPLFEPDHRVDDDVEVLVFGPARRTHDEPGERVVDAKPGQQRLAVPFAIAPLHRR